MYKEVAKRVLALILIFCMVGCMTDYSAFIYAADVGAEHIYANSSSGEASYGSLGKSGGIANAFTIEDNADTSKNAQILQSVSFALDKNSSDNIPVKKADCSITVSKYTGSNPLAAGGEQVSASATYDMDNTDGAGYFTVDMSEKNLKFAAGEKFLVKVEVSNAVLATDGTDSPMTPDPSADGEIHYAAASSSGISYVNVSGGGWNRLSGFTAMVTAKTAESAVETPVTGIALNKTQLELTEASTETLEVAYTPSYTSQKGVEWESTRPDVATVDKNGKVTAVKQGTATITATSTEKGTLKAQATVKVYRDIEKAEVTVDQLTYTGEELKPSITVKYNGQEVSAGEYSSSYRNNIKAGNTALVTITGNKNIYSGTKEVNFTIKGRSLSDINVTAECTKTYPYTGLPVTVSGDDLKVGYKGTTLTYGTDFIIKETDAYKNNINAGTNTATVTLQGQGNFTGERECTFSISKSIGELNISITPPNSVYLGKDLKDSVSIVVKDGATTLEPDRDYEIQWPVDFENYGTDGIKEIAIIGKGAYASKDESGNDIKKILTFTISRKNIGVSGDSTIEIAELPNQAVGFDKDSVQGLSIKYNGKELSKGTDYDVTCSDTSEPKAKVVITGKGNFTGQITREVNTGIDIKNGEIQLTGDTTYTGKEIEPTVKLVVGGTTIPQKDSSTGEDNYTVTFLRNKDAWKTGDDADKQPLVRVTGCGKYAGIIEKNFDISQRTIDENDSGFTFDYEFDWIYVPGGVKPPVTVTYGGKTLTEDDCGITYEANTAASSTGSLGQIVIKGEGNFKGQTKLPFNIGKQSLTDTTGIIKIEYTDTWSYNGSQIKPTVKITHVYNDGTEEKKEVLTESKDGAAGDYKLEYGPNINHGTDAYITLSAESSGNYTGTKTLKFTIEKFDIKNAEVSTIPPQEYTGSEIKPDLIPGNNFKVTILSGMVELTTNDYEVEYSQNTEAGKLARMILKGKGNFEGEKPIGFTIQKDIAENTIGGATITVEAIEPQAYTGSDIEPIPVLYDTTRNGDGTLYQLINGMDYELDWENNKKVAASNDANPPVIIVKGTGTSDENGNYKGTLRIPFTITKGSLEDEGIEITVSADKEDLTFTGSLVEPPVTVTYNGKTLTEGADEDYTLSYSGNTNTSDESYAIINGAKNFSGSKSQRFYIQPKELTDETAKITLTPDPIDFGAGRPAVTVTDKQRMNGDGSSYELVRRQDYNLEWKDNEDGTHAAEITGKGNYTGTLSKNYTVNPKDLSGAAVTMVPASGEYKYTGESITPVVSVVLDGEQLGGDDYEIICSNNTDPGVNTASFYIKGKGNYKGQTKAATFTILKKPISDDDISIAEIPNQAETGSPVHPKVNISFNGKDLAEGTDYTVEYLGNCTDVDTDATPAADKPRVVIHGIGKFEGKTDPIYFHIRPSLRSAIVTLSQSEYTYTSQEIRPVPVSVVLDGKTLSIGTDYELDYKFNTNAANSSGQKPPTVIVNGKNDYGGSVTTKFTIKAKNIANGTGSLAPDIEISSNGLEFTGSPITPDVELLYHYNPSDWTQVYKLKKGDDYTVQGTLPVNVGPGNITVYPRKNFAVPYVTGQVQVDVNVVPKDINNSSIRIAPIEPVDYTGEAIVPELTITDTMRNADGTYNSTGKGTYKMKLGQDGDYVIDSIKKNVDPGTAEIYIRGMGNYGETKTEPIKFTIKGAFANAEVKVAPVTYTGEAVEPKFTVTYNGKPLRCPEDYTYEVQNAVNCSDDSKIILVGQGDYAGDGENDTIVAPFKIQPKVLSNKDVIVKGVLSSYTFTGEVIKPEPQVTYNKMTLIEGTDYTLKYSEENPVDLGKYSVEIAAIDGGNYKESITKTYAIGSNFEVNVAGIDNSYTYTGAPIQPVPVVTLKKDGTTLTPGEDYEVQYGDNLKGGTKGKVEISGTGEYAGNMEFTFNIAKKSLNDTDITVAGLDTYTYTGEQVKPEPEVYWEQDGVRKTLNVGEDFTYGYSGNINAGERAVLNIKPGASGNFTGTRAINFTILPKDIGPENSQVSIQPIEAQTYCKEEIVPKLTIVWEKDDGKTITLTNKDYDLDCTENVIPGTARVTVTAKGNYTGSLSTTFEITNATIKDAVAVYTKNHTFTGFEIRPEVTKVTYKNKTLDPGIDYEVVYDNTNDQNIKAGTGKIKIVGKQYFTDTLECDFNIAQKSINDSDVIVKQPIPNQTLDSTSHEARPVPVITYTTAEGTYTLESPRDFELKYENNTAYGQYGKVTIIPKNNFKGSNIGPLEFYIGKDIAPEIQEANLVDADQLEYNGKPQKPKVQIYFKNAPLTSDDYELIYDEDCTSAGTHTVKINGKGIYGGSVDLTYTIGKRPIEKAAFNIPDMEFTGSPIRPEIIGRDEAAQTILLEDVSALLASDVSEDGMLVVNNAFTATVTNNVNRGKAVVSIKAADIEGANYKGTATAEFEIVQKNLASDEITCSDASDAAYTGGGILPELVLKDTRRNAAGSAYVAGTDSEYYTLKHNEDYTLSGVENVYPGAATVVATGKGNYTGFVSKPFNISGDLSGAVIADIPVQGYTGAEVKPALHVTFGGRALRLGMDYTVTYDKNIERGTAAATITAVPGSHYTGSKSASFIISKDISDAQIELIAKNFDYTGTEITPGAAVICNGVTLVNGVDYVLTYTNNVNAGTATLTATGIGAYSGTASITFVILKRSIIRCDFTDPSAKGYSGAPTSQQVQVVDSGRVLTENVDYTVEYKNNVNPGTATITVNGAGNYAGIKTIRYNINVPDMPQVTSKAAKDSITLSWPKVAGASGYEVYTSDSKLVGRTTSDSYKIKKLKSMKTYSYKVRPYVFADGATSFGKFSSVLPVTTTPGKPSIKVSAGTKKATISWKKMKNVSGYEIYRSTSKKGKYSKVKTLSGASKTKYTNSKLKSKKKYYYKVRAYKTVKGEKIYGSYSSVKSVKVK